MAKLQLPAALVAPCKSPGLPPGFSADDPTTWPTDVGGLLLDYDDAILGCDARFTGIRKQSGVTVY